MSETAFTPERNATGTPVVHHSSLRNKTVETHVSTEITGFLRTEHGVGPGVLIETDEGLPDVLFGRFRGRLVIGEF